MKINGCLMSKDIIIADICDGIVIPVNDDLLPLHFKNGGGLINWLEGRAIDTHRTNSRLLKKALRLTAADDIEVVLKVNAATITDTYWIRPEGSFLTYDDVRFKDNIFDKLALYGDPDSFNNGGGHSHTPELTNTGSFEKCWSIINGEWWMYKRGNDNELFSELFICEIGKSLGLNMAHYELDGKYIKSRDFTNGAAVNYEPAFGIVGKDEDYGVNYEAFGKLSEQCAADYIKMVYLDALCFNMDRHTNNYGILRDADSGEVLGMAPNFDNNIALISTGYRENTERKNDMLIRLFVEFLSGNKDALSLYNDMNIPAVDRGLIESCIDKVPVNVNRKYICEFILNGQQENPVTWTNNPPKTVNLTKSDLYIKKAGSNLTQETGWKVYYINELNYVRLRDVMALLDMHVDWDPSSNITTLDAWKSYIGPNLHRHLATKNECYITNTPMVPKGIMVHSTAANNTKLSRYVGPNDGILGHNTNYNHWNVYHPDHPANGLYSGAHPYGGNGSKCTTCNGKQVCVHAFIGTLQNGSGPIATYQILPWDIRGWHSGTGQTGATKLGSCR